MCAIFTVINKNKKNLDFHKCKKALDLMTNRGPDWKIEKKINNHVYLGQAVLSMTGSQKKKIDQHYSTSKNFFLLLVGEIYNYKKINSTYLKKINNINYSDSNVLVNLFEHVPKKKINSLLDGMYAYILYDKKQNTLSISRDPNGEKTLYTYEDNEKIIISSEINPILFYNKKINLNFDILKNYYLTRHFLELDKTIFHGIKKIETGTQIELNLSNLKFKIINKIKINDYIDSSIYNKNLKRSTEDVVDELNFLFNKNIKEMIPENRKFASIVSGGIDSSLVSNYICANSNPNYLIYLNHIKKDIHTDKIKVFEQFLKKKIHIHDVTEKKYFKNYLKSISICNSPINSHSFVGQFMNANIVSKHNCRAIFGGEGADELFGGYDTYLSKNTKTNINYSAYTKINESTLFSDTKEQVFFKKHMNLQWKKCLSSYSFISDNENKQKLAMMLMDATTQMESNAFKGSDLMSMNNSVEGRSLFYRRDIIKFALNLPIKFKINARAPESMKTKFILKKLFLRKFPKKLILKKQGFAGFPNEMKKYVCSLDKFILNNYLSASKLKNKFYKDRETQWKILNTELYLQKIGYKFL